MKSVLRGWWHVENWVIEMRLFLYLNINIIVVHWQIVSINKMANNLEFTILFKDAAWSYKGLGLSRTGIPGKSNHILMLLYQTECNIAHVYSTRTTLKSCWGTYKAPWKMQLYKEWREQRQIYQNFGWMVVFKISKEELCLLP
jgi:hypothetical protein